MDHNESVRKFEHLMLKQADHAREAAIELEALVSQMPSEKSRQLWILESSQKQRFSNSQSACKSLATSWLGVFLDAVFPRKLSQRI